MTPGDADNRGLRYGDGLFETMKFSGGEDTNKDWHLERLFSGMDLLQFDARPVYTGAVAELGSGPLQKKQAPNCPCTY